MFGSFKRIAIARKRRVRASNPPTNAPYVRFGGKRLRLNGKLITWTK